MSERLIFMKGYCETVIFMIAYLFDRSSPKTGPCTTERIGGKKIGWEEDESWETKSLILDKTSSGEINLLSYMTRPFRLEGYLTTKWVALLF